MNAEVRSWKSGEEQIPRLAALARDDREEQIPRHFVPRDDNEGLGRTATALPVVEAKLAGGALVESPANGTLSGRKWRVLVFEYGLSKNRYAVRDAGTSRGADGPRLPLRWTERAGRRALQHLDGARCFADHAGWPASGTGENACPTGGHSVRDLIGFFSEPALGARGPEATLTLLASERWAREKLLAAWEAGRAELIGFSIDAVIAVRPARADGQAALEVEDIASLHSVDMVSAASSGGRALGVLEGRDSGGFEPARSSNAESNAESGIANHKGAIMKQEIETMQEPGAGIRGPESKGQASLPQEGIPAQVQEQMKELQQQIGEAERRQRIAENRLRVNGKLAASRLPKPLADLVASRFQEDGPNGAMEIQEEDVEMEIQRVREAYAALSPMGRVMETGRVKVAREPEEKMQMALDRVFGLPVEDTSVPAFHGIREAYVAYTGDAEVTGTAAAHLRAREAYTTAGFPNALGNTLRRLLLKDYRDQDYGIGLIAQFSSVPDFRTQERVRVGYFGDLPTVDTEAADYGELTAPTDEKATYSVATFGGLVTVTRKTIINDDLGIVPQIVSRLGRSARRTLAQRVFNLMINNGAIYDGQAWFHASHGNLGSTALSAAELDVVRTAMRNRTEKDSGKKLGIGPHVLVAPHELEGLARQENERQYTDSNFTPNPARFLFGQQSERVIVSPLLSDANDWYVFANVQEAPTVEIGFLQGRQEPEFFLADQPTAAAVFTSDKIRYKVRHEHESVVIDYRGAYKEAVA